jgi:hypothetical protein
MSNGEGMGQALADAPEYQYFVKNDKRSMLVRRAGLDGPIDRLVNNGWVPFVPPRRPLEPWAWKGLAADELQCHKFEYLITNPKARVIPWRRSGARLRRSSLWRWLIPPLDGGAPRYFDDEVAREARSYYEQFVATSELGDLTELKEQALLGLGQQQDRCAVAEQRASFFLTAAGLTTSLVVANAGLLLGAGKLQSPWLQCAAAALAIASICSVMAGFRAIQGTSYTFSRAAPNAEERIFERSKLSGSAQVKAYVASLLVAARREGEVATWKVERLKAARRWFFGTIGGIVLLTAFVLVEVVR